MINLKKTLIIPDIHTGFVRAEAIIDKVEHDNVVFIGDYFDSFYDTLEETKQTAEWLKDSMEKENRIHLLGNHDLAYLDQNHICSGFAEEKLIVIRNVGVKLNELKHFCWVGEWLVTHAGLSNDFFKAYNNLGLDVNHFLHDLEKDPVSRHRLYDVSVERGGRNAFGGIVWCDYKEFTDIPGIKQIFGHTKGDTVRHGIKASMENIKLSSEHYCIDTGLKHYGLYDWKKKQMQVLRSGV